MSLRAYLHAARDAIRTAFALDETGCEVCPDGRPVPVAGQTFFSVHPGGSRNDATLRLDERFDFSVTLTLRTGVPPQDRIGVNILLDDAGILALADRLRALLHMSYAVMNAANALIPGFGVTANGFVEPLVFQSMQYQGEKGPDWFFAEGADDAACGLAVELSFGRARRIQSLDGPPT